MLNANLENYKILGAREVPEIEVVLDRELHRAKLDRCRRHRRIRGHHYPGRRHWQRLLQRNRSAHAADSDDASQRAGRARQGDQERQGMNQFTFVDCTTVDEALGQLDEARSSRPAASTCST